MRTTVSISDPLLELAKKASRERCLTLGEVIEEALRVTLVARPKSLEKVRQPTLVTYRGTGVREGIDLDSGASLLNAMDS